VNRKAVEELCLLVKETTQELVSKKSPEQLFTVDETGLPMNSSPGKIFAQRGIKKMQGSCKSNQCRTWRERDSWWLL
jgi:hypothetical protein